MRICSLTMNKFSSSGLQRFVPTSQPLLDADIEKLQLFLNQAVRLLVLTGAGVSTESGIPGSCELQMAAYDHVNYHSANVGLYARTDRRPMSYQEFVRNGFARQRYWARNFVGWPQFSSFLPNQSHLALAKWEKHGALDCVVTQNVDELHRKAGSQHVFELHGSSHRVVCLSCNTSMSRNQLQDMFIVANPTWSLSNVNTGTGIQLAPDGDILLSDELVENFKVPPCPNCGGVLKPDVVFFGDNVPTKLVDHIYGLVGEADSLLVAGSSLKVFSGYRFVAKAKSLKKRIAIVNIGQTRADDIADLKIEARCGEVLSRIQV